jgi:CarboxypepD_reg-like domain
VVLDEKSRKPIAGASIYISNSLFGTICSDEGLFNLSAFPAPSYLLTISAVGYETATRKIEQTGACDLVIVLKQRASELAEVVVRNAEKTVGSDTETSF